MGILSEAYERYGLAAFDPNPTRMLHRSVVEALYPFNASSGSIWYLDEASGRRILCVKTMVLPDDVFSCEIDYRLYHYPSEAYFELSKKIFDFFRHLRIEPPENCILGEE